jgi:hypothetical protein
MIQPYCIMRDMGNAYKVLIEKLKGKYHYVNG